MPEYYNKIGLIWDDLKDRDPDITEEFKNYAETTGDSDFDYMSLTGSKL